VLPCFMKSTLGNRYGPGALSTVMMLFVLFCFESTQLARQVQQERAQVEVQ